MTTDQMADAIARADGWTYSSNFDLYRYHNTINGVNVSSPCHPILSLDGCAAAWARRCPDWEIEIAQHTSIGWECDAWGPEEITCAYCTGDGPTELSARVACLYAVLVEIGKVKP